jgi:hypothetical protein
MAFYQGLTFPVLQLFWSDREGRFPWEKGVDPTILPFQPLLEEALLSRANLPLAVLGELEVPSSYADLFIDLSPEARELVLEEWRWLVGADAKVFRITVFGDLFIETKAGHIHFLDTGWGSCEEVAESAEQWAEKVKLHGPDWFHIGVLLDLRSLGMALNSRQVYSWAQLPMLGGAETVDNVNLVDGEVHISFSARVAEAIKDLPPGTAIEEIRWTPLGPKDA